MPYFEDLDHNISVAACEQCGVEQTGRGRVRNERTIVFKTGILQSLNHTGLWGKTLVKPRRVLAFCSQACMLAWFNAAVDGMLDGELESLEQWTARIEDQINEPYED